jgi:hypothetical protein
VGAGGAGELEYDGTSGENWTRPRAVASILTYWAHDASGLASRQHVRANLTVDASTFRYTYSEKITEEHKGWQTQLSKSKSVADR